MSTTDLDNILIERLKKNDEFAFTSIYNTYWKLLLASAYNVLKNKELCEDIIQDVFISLWRNRKQIEIKVSLKSYLYACTRYQVYDKIRNNKLKFHIELFDGLDNRLKNTSPETKLIYKELVAQITDIVNSLPEKCRKVYLLSREQNFSHKEIAKELNISTKTVENHITKALAVLRNSLGSLNSFFLFFFI